MDDTKQHDPMDQNADENESQAEVTEIIEDTAPVQPAEEAAVNIDTEVATEATENTAEESIPEAELEAEAEIIEEALKEKEEPEEEEVPKKKRRQSTSEKAKLAEAEKAKQRDPLRLRGKKYRTIAALVDKTREYPVEEAITLIKQLSLSKFDGAVDLHCQVQNSAIRGTLTLPHGTGKSKKVAVADDTTLEAIAAGKLDFDVLIATPEQMPKLAKYAKLLGPKGLMPSPKAGTVTDDLEKTSNEIGGGRVEYRADKNGIVHLSIGRISFPDEQLLENFQSVLPVLVSAKIKSLSLAPTMGPGVRILLTK